MLKAAGGGDSFYFLFHSKHESKKMLHTREHLPHIRGARRAARALHTACGQPQAPCSKIHLGMAGSAQ